MKTLVILTLVVIVQSVQAQTHFSSRLEMCSDSSKQISFIRDWSEEQINGKKEAPGFVVPFKQNKELFILSSEFVSIVPDSTTCNLSGSPACRKTVVQRVKTSNKEGKSSEAYVICTVVESSQVNQEEDAVNPPRK